MKQKLNTKALAIILAVCLIILGVIIYLLIPKECKHHFCDKTLTEPTCDTKGYTTYVCKKCEYTFEADFVAPLGHTYTSEITEPTCEEQGYTTHTCSACGYVKKDTVVAAKGHDLETKVTAPTCEAEGYTTLSCKNCDFVTVTDHKSALGHDIEDTVTAPTCEAEGYTTSKCKNCDYEYTSTYVDPMGHNLAKTTVAPTCTVQGYTTYKCQNCTHEYVSDYTRPTGHSLEKTTTAPTCDTQGYTTYNCANCDHSYVSDYTDPTGHTVSATETVAATCDTQGYTKYECSTCDLEYTADDVDPLGHSVSETEVVAVTCTTKGYTKYECANCDYEYALDVYPIGHSVIETVVSAPTYTAQGYTTYECMNCDYENTTFITYFDVFKGAKGTGEGAIAKGLDLSHHSLEVNFEQLKESGVDFVILRVGFDDALDTKFEEYYAAAREAGLDIGVYFFTLATNKTEARADADRVAQWLEGKTFEYPIFYDVEEYIKIGGDGEVEYEYDPTKLDQEVLMDIAHTFITTMLDYGYYPGLYTNDYYVKSVFETSTLLSLYDVWYARYQTVTDDLILDYSDDYSMWQYAGDVYEFTGVSGACDLNYAFKDYPTIIKKYGFNGYGS